MMHVQQLDLYDQLEFVASHQHLVRLAIRDLHRFGQLLKESNA